MATDIPIPESALSGESAAMLAEWAHANAVQERESE